MRRALRLGLVIALGAGACGGLGTGGSGDAGRDAFVGSWNMSGVTTLEFETPYGPISTDLPTTGLVLIAAGEGPDDLVVTDERGCAIPATVSGGVASVDDGASCTVVQGTTTTVLVFHSGTLTLEDEGSISLDASGDATVTSTSGSPGGSGTFTWTATLARGSGS